MKQADYADAEFALIRLLIADKEQVGIEWLVSFIDELRNDNTVRDAAIFASREWDI